jgi:hypothetical protein
VFQGSFFLLRLIPMDKYPRLHLNMLRSAYGPVLPETVPQRMAQIDAPDPWLEPPACPKVSKEVAAPKTRMFLRDVQTVSRISKALGLAQQAKGSGCVDYIDYSYRKDLYVTCLKCLFASCSCFCHCSGSLDEPASSTFTGFSDSSGPGSGFAQLRGRRCWRLITAAQDVPTTSLAF